MKRAAGWLALAAICVIPFLYGAYTYFYSCSYGCFWANWSINGSYPFDFGNGYFFSNGSAIYTGTVPGNEYEVYTPITNGQATYIHYLRASTDSMLPQGLGVCTGTFYALTFGSGYASAYKCVNGTLTYLATTSNAPAGSATWQSVMTANGTMLLYRNSVRILQVQDTEITTGKPGVGGFSQNAANSFAPTVKLGPLDSVAPNAVTSFSASPFPTFVDLQWGTTSDDANGSGVVGYEISRGGQYLGETSSHAFTDSTVAASTTYSYSIRARDLHNNLGPATTISVTTPAAGAVDARRTGVRPDGSYWGAGGEEIDMRSGNLNFTLPLLRPEGRGGWGVTFALTYNSQNWRKDTNGQWKLGQDVGYGFGWRLLAGSITPVFTDLLTVHHYIFTDSTGAEYRLAVNTGGVWTSRESAYVKYDANQAKLYFSDGSAWEMNCLSGGTEDDAGTRYPTRMEDTSGNFIDIAYRTGNGAVYSNSSARISTIGDVRASGGGTTYTFTYNADAIPHLTGITNSIGTAEAFSFSYTASQTLYGPFAPQQSFGSAQMLQIATRTGVNLSHSFEYGTNGAGEMSKVTLPFGGELRWTYADFAYTGGRTYREVVSRQLVKQAGAAPTTYPITRPAGDSAFYVHSQAVIDDPGGQGQRAWNFTTAAGFNIGLVSSYEQRQMPGSVVKAKQDYTWTQDANQRLYISAVLATIEPGTGNQKQSKTEQTLDVYGNVTQTKQYAFGNLSTPARTYTNTYLATGTYPTYHLNNRLLTSQVTNGTSTLTLVSNTYDGGTALDPPTTPTRWNASHTGPAGRLTASTGPGTIRNMSYYKTGNLASINDGYGHSTDITPSQAANYARPAAVTANGNSDFAENYTWNTSFLGLTQETGPNGVAASVSYDTYARVQQTTSPDGAVTTYAYTNSPPTATATTNGHWVKSTYDGLGRPIKVERGDAGGTKSITETEYDSCACTPLGKLKRVSQPYAPGGTVFWTVYNYDGLGRTTSVTHADGVSTSVYSYSGNTMTVTDPAGKWRKYERDAFGNVTKTIEPNPAGGADWESTFTYNYLGSMTQVQMTRGAVTQTRSFAYDAATLRLTSETHPETGTTSYSYNSDGSLFRKTMANGKMLTYSYDAYGRVVNRTSGNCDYVWHYYDNAAKNAMGKLWKVSYSTESCASAPYIFNEELTYNAGGRVTQKRLYLNTPSSWPPWTSSAFNVNYGYNNEGQVNSISGPSGTYNYTFDGMARPAGMTGAATVSNVNYNAADQLLTMTHDGVQETRQYNSRLQLTRITVPGQMDLEYRYSATQNNGQITSLKNWINGEEVNYGYDALGRLTSASTTGPEWGLTFAYDGFGNKTAQTVTKGTAPAMSIGVDANNRVVGQSYDASGFTTAVPGTFSTLVWDGSGRLESATVQGGATDRYVYDPSGQRVWRNNQLFLRGIGGSVMEIWNFDPGTKTFTSLVKKFGYFAGRKVGQKEDKLGTVQNGSRFYPYGEESASTSNDTDKFATYWRDSNTGLDYAMNRYYQASLGRFMSPDPYRGSSSISRSGSWNRYGYVEGDPVNLTDATGLVYDEGFDGPMSMGERARMSAEEDGSDLVMKHTDGSILMDLSGLKQSSQPGCDYPGYCENGYPGGPVFGSDGGPAVMIDAIKPSERPAPLLGLPTETCDIITRLLGECGEGSESTVGAIAALAARRANPLLWVLLGAGKGYVNMMRLAGEKAVQNITGLIKNGNAVKVNERFRIPDFVDDQLRMLHEVKNTFSVAWTEQIRDLYASTQIVGSPYQGYNLTIWHRYDVIPSATMRANAATFGITLREFVP